MTTPSPTQVTTNYYDTMLRLWKTTLPDGTSQTNVFYHTSQTEETSGSRTYPVGYSYDGQNRMITMTNWNNFPSSTGARVTTWNYDLYRGFLTNKTYAGSTPGPIYTYTAAGRLAGRTWARGTNTAHAYNGAGDLATVTYNDGVTAGITNGFDRRGRLVTISNAAIVTSLTYNDANEVLTESYSGGLLCKCPRYLYIVIDRGKDEGAGVARMPRLMRIEYLGAIYHLMNRGDRRLNPYSACPVWGFRRTIHSGL